MSFWTLSGARLGGGWVQQSRAGAGPGTEARPQPGGSQFLVAVGWLRQLLGSPAMVPPLPWLSRSCCRRLLLPPWCPALQGSWRCCSQGRKASTEKTSSTGTGQMSPSREPWPRSTAELAQAEELLEQQLELYQALLEGQEGAWEAQALVLKIQKLKEQMRRHRESLGEDA
ncbi:mitochondrial coiled-coil domain protein 1 [Mesoplodon densirostris]|uniref:mitochondrial coiled-coil domain protein 1 n=1 Tax=Mesoplodon densirostris TaxID=48708 RepID=UPI0028DB9989|nr:mitochondrial coiled-coil domain protein 1 [Mesoplodon densirostris]